MGSSKQVYEFGPFRLDTAEGQLWRDGEEIQLTQKSFKILMLLVENGGHVLDKNELMEKVWPDAFVEENRLADSISTLRKLLSDDPKAPTYIRTVSGRGYRFVADVREGRAETTAVVDHTTTRIVIEEELETPADELQAKLRNFHKQAVAPALLQAGTLRWRLKPLVIAASCVLIGALSVATYFALRGRPEPPAGQTPLASSIAVLPFKPLVSTTSDPALEMGMTDALITKLTNIRAVVVRPTSSVMKYTVEGQDLRAAGSELGVDVLLDGRVQKLDDRIRLSVQLVRVSDGTPLWADKFDEKFTDIFAVQDSISERVAMALALRITGEERKGLAKRYTENVEAYQLYLKGRDHWSKFRPDDLLTSINYYNEALKKDPNYALAYSGLANSYIVISIYGPLPAAEAMPKAQAAIQKALALDDNLADAHVSRGAIKIFYERDWPGAEAALKRAMELNPNHVDAPELYGYYLQAMGRVDEAVTEFKRSADRAPQWSVPENDLLQSYFEARRYDEAVKRCLETIKLEPNHARANQVLGLALTEKKQFGEAIAALQRAIGASGDNERSKALSQLGYTYAVSGRSREALKVIDQLKVTPNPWLSIHIAKIYAGLGDKPQAFVWLEKSAAERFAFLYEIVFLPQFDSLRPDPRYAALVRNMNLKP